VIPHPGLQGLELAYNMLDGWRPQQCKPHCQHTMNDPKIWHCQLAIAPCYQSDATNTCMLRPVATQQGQQKPMRIAETVRY